MSMADGNDERSRRPVSGLLFWPVCLAGVGLVALGVLGPEAKHRQDVERQIVGMQGAGDRLTQTKDQLATAAEALRDDPQYQERIIRHELGIVRPGEIRMPQPVEAERMNEGVAAPTRPRDLPRWVEPLILFAEDDVRTLSLGTGAAMLLAGFLMSLPVVRTKRD